MTSAMPSHGEAVAVLAADVGTTACKVAAVGGSGRVLSRGAARYGAGAAAGPGGVVEQPPGEWLAAFRAAAAACLAGLGPPHPPVAAVALSGMMQNVTLVRGRAALRPSILYSDTRAVAAAAAIERQFGPRRLAAETTNLKGPASCLAKLLWLHEHEPAALGAAEQVFLGAHDFLSHLLCDSHACDVVTLSTTGLLAPDGRSYCARILGELQLGAVAAMLPEIQRPEAMAGELRGDVAAELGLAPGTPVYLAPGDLGTTAVGTGAPMHAYLGTSGWIARHGDATGLAGGGAAAEGLFRIRHPSGLGHLEAASMQTAGGNVEHTARLLGLASPAEVSALAAEAAPGAGGLIYLPHLSGERSPFLDSQARAGWVGVSPATGRPEMARSVLEGVAMHFRLLHRLVVGGGGAGDAPLPFCGGGSTSPVWTQILADCLGLPIRPLGDAADVGARGAAAMALQALGHWGDGAEAPRAFFTGGGGGAEARTVEPGAAAAMYQELAAAYEEIYPALKAGTRVFDGPLQTADRDAR